MENFFVYPIKLIVFLTPGLSFYAAFRFARLKNGSAASRYLSVFLLLLGTYFLIIFTDVPGVSAYMYYYLMFPVQFGWMPLLYLFIFSMLNNRKPSMLNKILHLSQIVFVLFLLVLGKAAAAGEGWAALPAARLAVKLTKGIVFLDLAVALQIALYVALIAFEMFRHFRKLSEASPVAVKRFRWVLRLIAVSILSFALSLPELLHLLDMKHIDLLSVGCIVLFILVSYSTETHLFTDEILIRKDKYKTITLNADTIDQYILEIESTMVDEELYKDQSLTLNKLARHLTIPPHHVSLVINSKKHKNFVQFVNGYRIDYAKTLLLSDEYPNILQIAFESGFNSKTSFNTIFKKVEGITPSEYRVKNRILNYPA